MTNDGPRVIDCDDGPTSGITSSFGSAIIFAGDEQRGSPPGENVPPPDVGAVHR
jgi:hypothetical protein